MKSCSRRKHKLTPPKTRQFRFLKIGLVLSATSVCLIIATLVVIPSGQADAGIGQPVTLGPSQVFPTGSGPYALTAYFNDLGPALAVVNNASDTVSVIQRTNFTEGFGSATNYPLPAGAHPQAVAIGTRGTGFFRQRFLIVADTGINKVSVLMQDGSTFQQAVNYDVGTAPHDVAVAHLDSDSNLDIVTANFGSNNVTILSGNADGTFGNLVSHNVSATPRAIVVGSLDNNFTTDIVTCGSDAGAGKVNVLFRNSGTFQPGGTYTVGTDPHDVALGDFNRDDKPDVVTANTGSNDITVLLNDGAGGFTAANQYAAGPSPRSVAVEDFNRDGKLDVAVASATNGLNLLLNNGDGTFAPPVNFAMGQNPFGLAVGFFGGNGLPGFATANNGDGTVTIRGNQTVPFVTFATPIPHTVNAKPHSLATFERFGKRGLAVTNNDPNNSGVSVLYRSDSFSSIFNSPTHYPLLAGSQPEQVVVGNLGQIPLPSLVVALPNANKVGILLGNSDDAFQLPVYKDVGTFPRSITLADFNSDGNLDIAAANGASNTISMIFGNADRTFQNAFTVANVLSASPEFIVSGDFNADGKADVATCNSGAPDHNKVNVLFGNGNGTFQPMNVYTVGLKPGFMTTGDFNKDGKLDLAVSNSSENKVSVLLNNGSGVFQSASHYPVGSHPNSISTGDFNLDGETDLVVTNGESKTFSVLLNNGDGTFKGSLSFIVGQGPLGIAVADFNIDNKPDVVTANNNDGTLSVILNSTPAPASLVPSPHNDNFANAETLSGISEQTLGTNVGATLEVNEPSSSSSVWYTWTAPADGGITIDTFGSTFNTRLAVYTGSSLGSVTQVAQNDDDLSPGGDQRVTSKVKFTAVSGTTYKISVSSFGDTGNITLNWSLVPPPSNDNFANAEIISGATGVRTQTNAGATKEQGEPNHADDPGGASIWFRWTAPSGGTVTFNTSSSRRLCDSPLSSCRYDTLLALYKGSTLQEVSQAQNLVAKNDDQTSQNVTSSVTFIATEGTTYRIAVDSKGTLKSDITISWFSGSNFNDSFASAVQISGFTGNSGSEIGPSSQAWFRWVAPASGSAKFTSGHFFRLSRPTFEFPSTLSIHSVTGQNALSVISSNTGICQDRFADRSCQDSTVTFNAVGQAVYAIQVSKPQDAAGLASLHWELSGAPGPPNDNLAGAQVISGFQGNSSFNNTNATKEPSENNHGSDPGGHSVWFNWTAPETLQFTFSTSQFSGQVFLGVYTGSTMPTLAAVGGASASVSFSAVKDTTYRIAVDSQSQGSGFLNWRPTNAPPNDNFVNAQSIVNSSGKVAGTNSNATSEPGEPPHGSSSIWYSWTAPSNGFFTFNTDGSKEFASEANTILAVYVGPAVNNLSHVITNDNESTFPFIRTSRVTFFALAGQVYKIAVTGTPGTIRLQWGEPRSIGGRITNIRGIGIANVTVSLEGDGLRTRRTDAQGFYNFPDVPTGGDYAVTPSRTSYGYEVNSLTYNSLSSNVTDANFVATTPAYNIEGRITRGGIPVVNVQVNLTGTAKTTVETNEQGAYEFSNLPTDGNYTVTPSSPFFTFKAFSGDENAYTLYALNDNQTDINFIATPTVPPLELLVEESETPPNTQAAALEALPLLRDPFPLLNDTNLLFSEEQNTRVLLFVRNLQLAPNETPAIITVHIVDAFGQTHDVRAESFREIPGLDLRQITFRLPEMLLPGTYTIDVRAHGQTSNAATIRIRM